MNARWRVAAASATIGLLLGGALVFTVHSRGGSAQASAYARQQREDSLAAEQAVSAFWEEREAMGEWLAFPSRARLENVREMRLSFRRALAAVETQSPDEHADINQARVANEVLIAIFNVQPPFTGGPADERGERLLNSAEASVLVPIARLSAVNRTEYLRAEAVAASTERAGFRSELAASLLGLAAIALFAIFAVRLVGRIENQNVELQLADVAKDEFIGNVSHELRTPLTSMHGFVELLLDESGEPLSKEEQRIMLSTVQRGSVRLGRLVNDLLLTAQFRAGRLEMRKTRIDVAEIVRESVENAQAQAAQKTLQLSLTALPHTIQMEADAVRLSQAVDNVIANAIKFTPEGGRVEVAVAQNGDRANITVSDTGMGMTAADIERLFEPFFRTDAAQAKQIQGTGLGLPIVKAIVEAHDGTITITSEPNIGTSFAISLPLAHPLLTHAADSQAERFVAA